MTAPTTTSQREKPSPRIRLGEYFEYLAGDAWRQEVLAWPPDVFCLAAALLQRTGGYIRVVGSWPPGAQNGSGGLPQRTSTWTQNIAKAGRAWWLYASQVASGDKKPRLPEEVRQWWTTVVQASDSVCVEDLVDHVEDGEFAPLWTALLELAAAADEACCGIGLVETSRHQERIEKTKRPHTDILVIALRNLTLQIKERRASTLTRHIRPSVAIVLPKLHTPQSGITLRSLSHHLALLKLCEVTPQFISSLPAVPNKSKRGGNETEHAINLLLVPWPEVVNPVDFKSVKSDQQSMSSEFGFFGYMTPEGSIESTQVTKLEKLMKEAQRKMGRIDGVVFPELALTDKGLKNVIKTVIDEARCGFLIAGVGGAGTATAYGSNKAVYVSKFADVPNIVEQHKHHRWQLDRGQLEQYGIGACLNPSITWWEHTEIKSRRLSFISVNDRLTLSILICEDLARQDPVADIIRAVGPNLVVALLMDGPQLSGRWPAHYATVFADDPGSSVLTFTSIGMTQLCRPKEKPKSRVVGLWKDKLQGFREIILPEHSHALVLSLTIEEAPEWTADGRSEDGSASYLKLNGIHPIEAVSGP